MPCLCRRVCPIVLLPATGTLTDLGDHHEPSPRDRRYPERTPDQVGCPGLLADRRGPAWLARGQAERRGEERLVVLAARRGRVDQGAGRAVAVPVTQHLRRCPGV